MAPPSRRLKIAVLHRTFRTDAGGAEAYAVAIALELAKRHEVHVFAQDMDFALQGVRFHPIAQFFKRPRWLNQLWYALASAWMTAKGFDIVHSHENTLHGDVQTVHVLPMRCRNDPTLGWMRQALHGLKVATSLRLMTYTALESARFAVQAHRHWVAVSKPLQLRLQSMHPVLPAAQLHCIAPGIYLPNHLALAPSSEAAQAPKRLLWVGNDAEKKNIFTVLKALSLLDSSYTLTVVGQARPIQAWQSLVTSMGLTQRVQYLGVVNTMAEVYASADVLIHPTLEDTFGMVVLEAMAHGLAVVVSQANYCGIAAELQHGVNAQLLEDPHNAQSIADAVMQLADASLYNNHRVNAQAFAKQHLWVDAAAQYEAIFEQLTAP